MKKLVAAALAVATLATMSVSAKAKIKSTNKGKVINIYCWNNEFRTRFEKFYKAPAGVEVKWVEIPNQDNAYQNKLDEALRAQATAKADDKVDLFLVEADYALKYVDTDATLDVVKEVGLKKKDLTSMFQYTKDIMTDADGILKGVSWQGCPAGMIYRRSYAKKLFGTDDPKVVQSKVSDWTKFAAVAEQAKAAGYKMVSGYDDTYRIFTDNVTSKWVKGNKINIDPQINNWIAQTKEFTDKGYNNKTSLWAAEWNAGMMMDGGVFSYFGPAWLIDFCMAAGDPASAAYNGDWGFCAGPQSFSWGGTWICAAAGTDNLKEVKDIMYQFSCDKNTLVNIVKEYNDFTNNIDAMKEIAATDYKNKVLGGQNPLNEFITAASAIKKPYMSTYDQGMTEEIQHAMKDYFDGIVDLDTAWANFYTAILEKYPELKK